MKPQGTMRYHLYCIEVSFSIIGVSPMNEYYQVFQIEKEISGEKNSAWYPDAPPACCLASGHSLCHTPNLHLATLMVVVCPCSTGYCPASMRGACHPARVSHKHRQQAACLSPFCADGAIERYLCLTVSR